MDTAQETQLITPGVIAKAVGVDLHVVLHILRTRRHIRPVARAGRIRLFGSDAVAQVRHEISAIEARRCRRGVEW